MHVPESSSEKKETLKEDLSELLDKYNMGFKRPERLDVKKPGPPFATTDSPGSHGI